MKLRLDGDKGALVEIDLGTPGEGGYLEGGVLDHQGGNLYLFIDDVEYGSLFFHEREGVLNIELGQFDSNDEEWVDRNPLNHPVDADPKDGG